LATDCETLVGQFPWPPANATAMSAFHLSDTDIRWDNPADLNTGPDYTVVDTSTTAVVEVVVNGTPTIAAAATATLTVVSAPVAVGSTITVDDVVLTAVDSETADPDEFDGSSTDPAVVATKLAAAVNNGSVGAWGIASATSAGTSITLLADEAGVAGNSFALVSTSSVIIASAATFSGGADLTILTIGQYTLTAVDGGRTPGGSDFDINDAGVSLAEAINDPDNPFSYVTASWGGTCVLISAAVSGTTGNGITVSSTSATLFPARTATQGGSGTPCPLGQDNSRWTILGVNIYRSDTGDRGPYFRVNRVPVGTQFYRDRTDIVEVPAEVVSWSTGWVFKSDSPNNKGWRIKTQHATVVKREGNAVPADSPFDVEVYIGGERAVVTGVFGPTGEIDISTEQVWNPATEAFELPPTPSATSEVLVRYFYQRTAKLHNTLDNRHKVFYRVASVAVDTTGTSPTGLSETPLEYCPPVSPMDSEQLDYMWREAIKRNQWILDQGGERVKLFIRRVTGNKCDCVWDPRLEAYSKQPLNNCLMCYGTGWIGGYEGPYNLIVGPDDTDRRVTQTPNGRRLEHAYEVWIGPSPMTSQRDFIVKQNGERYSIGPVRRTQVRGRTLQQTFQIGYLDTGDIRYSVPMSALERLPWPQTRYTSPQLAPCEDSAPYPIGTDPQAGPMMSEKKGIPDAREKRGRTPVFQNATYGGKGGR
jgi:hypothetical protein